MDEQRLYAIANDMTLFGKKTKQLNLDKFTNKESNIHSERTHHKLNVNIYEFHHF